MFRKSVLRSIAILAGVLPLAAPAATATGSLAVSATVLDVCTVSALPIAFGNFSPSGSATDATTTITVLCTLNTPYTIRLDDGANGSAVTARKMKIAAGTDTLDYALYSDASRTQNWGETDGTDSVAGTGTGLSASHTVYGRISASQYVPAGVYTDTVTITVNY